MFAFVCCEVICLWICLVMLVCGFKVVFFLLGLLVVLCVGGLICVFVCFKWLCLLVYCILCSDSYLGLLFVFYLGCYLFALLWCVVGYGYDAAMFRCVVIVLWLAFVIVLWYCAITSNLDVVYFGFTFSWCLF